MATDNREKIKEDLFSLTYLDLKLFSELEDNNDYVNFSGFTKEQVIKALFNSTQHLGLGFLLNDQEELILDDILSDLDTWIYQGKIKSQEIDYLKGKPLKINLIRFPFIFSGDYDINSRVKMKDVLKEMSINGGKIDFVEEEIIPEDIIIKEAKGKLGVEYSS